MRRQDFRQPPAECSVAYFWGINGREDVAEAVRQLRDMARQGVKAVCLHPLPVEFRPGSYGSLQELPYLSSEYFRFIRRVVAACRRLGMHYWLYDEGGWPSGSACGQVLATAPERFQLLHVTATPTGPAVVPVPQTRTGSTPPYPNLLTPGSTAAFLQLTHGQYAREIGGHFGQTVRYVFQDEAVLGRGAWPWTADFGAVFRRRKGYRLEPLLGALLQAQDGQESPELTRARVDYRDVLSQLFVERFLLPVRSWCRAHGLLSAGHFGGEDEPRGNADYGYGHIMRSLRALDLPGVDVIWRQLFPGARNRVFPKYASSLARQSGRQLALTESAAVYGDGLTPAQLLWLLEYQLVRGINTVVLSGMAFSHAEHLFLVGTRPHFGPVNPLWKYSRLWHDRVGRLCCLLRQGRAAVTTAVYYDVRSIWAGGKARAQAIEQHEAVSEALLQRQCDFDFVDDDALVRARVAPGALIVGRMRYDTIVLPTSDWMEAPVRARLAAFVAAGGRVVDGSAVGTIRPVLEVTPASPALRACKRVMGRRTMYYVVNEGAAPVSACLRLDESGEIVLADPDDGRYYAVESSHGRLQWAFAPYGSAVFMTGVRPDAERPGLVPGGPVMSLASGWRLRPVRQYAVAVNQCGPHDLSVEACPVGLGDWRPSLGDYFSGDAEYAIDFEWGGPATAALLDLGEVRYACSVVLNGRRLDDRAWPPFAYDVSGRLRHGRNRLAVTVTNTLANAIADPGVLDSWRKRYPGRSLDYDQRQRVFEADSLPSGLFGPVTLRPWCSRC